MLHTLAMLRSLNFRDYKVITVVINGDEEISTPGARNLISQLGGEHDVVFSCEPTPANQAGHPLSLATSGIGAALITVRGKSAHAGVAPELGRNALIELSHQLVQTRDLSDPARQIKFNWTMGSAGRVVDFMEKKDTMPHHGAAAALRACVNYASDQQKAAQKK